MSRGPEGAEQTGPDLRLVLPAVAAWLMVIGGLALGWVFAAVLTALAALGAVVAGWRVTRTARVARPRAAGLLATAAAGAAAGMVITVQSWQAAGHPVRAAAAAGSAATVRVVLDGDPQPVRSDAFGARPAAVSQVVIAARLQSAEVGDERWTVGGKVLLIAEPAGWSELSPGQPVRAEGLLAPAIRADLTVAVLRVRGPPQEPSAAPWWQRSAGTLRHGLREAAGVLPEPAAALLPGLAIGDTGGLTATVEDDFRAAGLTHLTAVSGTNVIIVCGAVLGLLRLLRAGPRTQAGFAFVALMGFVVLARPSASVLRAAVMGGVVLLALALGRRRSAVPALAGAVLSLLLLDPALGLDPGFALSVLATAALVLVAPGWVEALRWRGVPPGVAEALVVPMAAHVATLPVIAGLSGQISLVAVVANLLAAPVVAPATVLGVLAAVVSPALPTVAGWAAAVAGPEVEWLLTVAHRSASVPGAVVPWPAGVPGAVLLAGVVIAGLALLRSRRWRAIAAAALVGALLVLVPTRLVPPGWPVTGWSMVACDVGQGDAIVVRVGEPGRAVLVDTGPEPSIVDDCLTRLGVTMLPLVVLSHLHADHIGGLAGALRGRSVGAVAMGPSREPAWALAEARRVAESAGVPVVGLTAGRRLAWPGLVLDVLAPLHVPGDIDPDDGTAVNDTSLVLRARTPAGTILLTGDIELAAQAELLASGAELRADVLKVPHHGSRYSSPALLAAVRPRIALVSVGAGNRYGHPNAAVLDALRTAGAVVRRTDQAGDLAVAGTIDEPAVLARGDPRPAPRH